MTRYVALLRAVNVGGTGKLPMSDLKAMCEEIGFTRVQTYIASGNVLFDSPAAEADIVAALEQRLHLYAGKPVGVLVRAPAEMAQILADNPFPDALPNRTVAIFLPVPAPPDALDHVKGRGTEQIVLGKREIYVHYGDGMADSKLQIAAAKIGTARNMNSIAKLSELAHKTA